MVYHGCIQLGHVPFPFVDPLQSTMHSKKVIFLFQFFSFFSIFFVFFSNEIVGAPPREGFHPGIFYSPLSSLLLFFSLSLLFVFLGCGWSGGKDLLHYQHCFT